MEKNLMQFHPRHRVRTALLGGAVALLITVTSNNEGRALEPVHSQTVLASGTEFQIISDQMAPVRELRVDSRPETPRPTQALLSEIVAWLSENSELPAIHDHPRVEFVSAMRLVALRYKNLLPDRTDGIDVNSPTMQASLRPDIVGVYHDKTQTIYLVDTWTGANATDISILVHEMVHHLQNLAELKYECAGAREKLAYLAQEAWLKRYGLDLEHEFEIDKFTLLIKSSCMF